MPGGVERPDQEPVAASPAAVPSNAKPPSSRRSFTSARRELSEEELGTPAVQRLLLDEIDRLEACERDADTARSLFHEADKRAAVLEEKGKVSTAQEVVSIICLAVGGALLGFAPSIWSTQPVASVALALGVVLVIGGVVAKVWMQR